MSHAATRRLAPRTGLPDDVADHLRDLIVSGQVRAGEFLRLESLAEQLGTSVTPVREALVSLRGEGFVVLQPRRGFVVAPFTKQDILDVYQVQAYLAGELAARACVALEPDALDRLHTIQLELEAAHHRERAEEVERLNHEFHRAINVTAGAPKLAQFLATAARYSPRLFYAQIAGWTQASAVDHDVILTALGEGHPQKARAAMTDHVSKAGALLADHLQSQGLWNDEESR
ncbi:MAG: GntR family transcriptional regulator [Marmoricola sp.]